MSNREMITEYAEEIAAKGVRVPSLDDIEDAPQCLISDLQEVWIKLYG